MRILGATLFAALIWAHPASAQQAPELPAPPAEAAPEAPRAEMGMMARCQAMMAMHQARMQEIREMRERLEQKLEALREAEEPPRGRGRMRERVDAIAAVVEELAEQHLALLERREGAALPMMGHMMRHMGAMMEGMPGAAPAGCPMMMMRQEPMPAPEAAPPSP